jgi:hypothetical protein
MGGGRPSRRDRRALAAVRLGLPALIAVVGVVLIVLGGEIERGAGIVLVGVSLLVVLANQFLRIGLSSERDREREEARRQEFGRTGRWPEDR